MKAKPNPAYIDAAFELTIIGVKGKKFNLLLPYRFNRPLTDAEWKDAHKNGFEKYAIEPYLKTDE